MLRKSGRPKLDDEERLDVLIKVRVRAEERRGAEKAATRRGVTLSVFVRDAIIEAARQEHPGRRCTAYRGSSMSGSEPSSGEGFLTVRTGQTKVVFDFDPASGERQPSPDTVIMARNEKTSKSVASKASKVLSNPNSTKSQKSVAASALTQAADKKKRK